MGPAATSRSEICGSRKAVCEVSNAKGDSFVKTCDTCLVNLVKWSQDETGEWDKALGTTPSIGKTDVQRVALIDDFGLQL